jgi:hypothetical protein
MAATNGSSGARKRNAWRAAREMAAWQHGASAAATAAKSTMAKISGSGGSVIIMALANNGVSKNEK